MTDVQRFGPRDLAVAAVMNVMWGLNIVAVKMAVDTVEPMTAAFLRQGLVALICLPFLRVVPGRMRHLLTLGVLSGCLFYIAINLSLVVSENVSALAIAGQLGVPFSLILAVLVLGERIRGTRIAGVILSFGGVALLGFDPALGGEIPGLLLTALASAIWAVCSLIQRNLTGVPVLTIYAWVGLVGAILLLPVVLVAEPGSLVALGGVPRSAFGWIAFSAIGSTIMGTGAMSWLLQRHPVTSVMPLTLAAPVIGTVVASIFFAKPLTMFMIVGGAIALIGVAIVTLRTAKAGSADGWAL